MYHRQAGRTTVAFAACRAVQSYAEQPDILSRDVVAPTKSIAKTIFTKDGGMNLLSSPLPHAAHTHGKRGGGEGMYKGICGVPL